MSKTIKVRCNTCETILDRNPQVVNYKGASCFPCKKKKLHDNFFKKKKARKKTNKHV